MRKIYDKYFYTTKLKKTSIEISEKFNSREYWGDKVDEGVIVAYDFIPYNKELKLLEINTNVGIFKEYIPYFDFDELVNFFVKNNYKKIVAIINHDWGPIWDNIGKNLTPAPTFIDILTEKLIEYGINISLKKSAPWPQPVPKIKKDGKTFVLRFSFDPDSKIDSLAASKKSFLRWACDNNFEDMIPKNSLTFDIDSFPPSVNDNFPSGIIKKSNKDNRIGMRFLGNVDNVFDSENKKWLHGRDEYLEEFIVSDVADGLEQYNIEMRSLVLVTNKNSLCLNTEPFVGSSVYVKKGDSFIQQNAYGTSFIKDTEIILWDGETRKIQDIKKGDKIKCYDIKEIKEKVAWKDWVGIQLSTNSKVNDKESFVRNVVSKKSFGYVWINEKVKLTPHAACFIKINDKEWKFKRANDLIVGETILLDNSEYMMIETLDKSDDVVDSYGLEVDTYNNYFGGNIFTHNVSVGSGCFVAGTKVLMEDGSEKNIEDIKVGDIVRSYNVIKGFKKGLPHEYPSVKVTEVKRPLKDNIVRITAGGSTIRCTIDHPIVSKGRGWCSVRPDLFKGDIGSLTPGHKGKRGDQLGKLNVGDIIYQHNGRDVKEVQIESIIYEPPDTIQTYIFKLEKYQTFFANGILTHNKGSSLVTSHLVSRWQMGDDSASDTTDWEPYSTYDGLGNLSLINAPTRNSGETNEGGYNSLGYYRFNGSNEYGYTDSTFNSSDWTVVMWLKHYATQNGWYERILAATSFRNELAEDYYNRFRWYSGTWLNLESSGYPRLDTSDSYFTNDRWMMWCHSNEGTTNKMYINDSLRIQSTSTNYGKTYTGQTLYVGASQYGSENWSGYIGQISIYNDGLTQAEITNLYNHDEPYFIDTSDGGGGGGGGGTEGPPVSP